MLRKVTRTQSGPPNKRLKQGNSWQVGQEVSTSALQLTRPIGVLSVTGVGMGQGWERQRPL
ncbi:unnamed protein product, partial [Pleuronectes platessa]